MSVPTFAQLVREGVLPQGRGRGGYKIDDARRAYIQHLRARSGASPEEVVSEEQRIERLKNQDDLGKERARLAAEQADKAAMQNAVMRRELLPVAVLERYAEQVAAVVRAALEALPAQCKRRIPHLRSEELNLIKAECARASDAIADFDANDADAA